ncbi:MAG TPA: tetratricopeptide repeat protein [Terriglobales bacterium]|nr:tetratricopeptide repeat protein [Terriglobales bacterium]
MGTRCWHPRLQWAMLTLVLVVVLGCNKASNSVSASSDSAKLPVTTASEEARKEYLTGRDLSERLQANDSVPHFDKALALDPEFALAELGRANNSPTPREFFEHMRKAVTLSPKASNGEKLLILANQAGANGLPEIQKEYLDQLVQAYPNDERVQFTVGNYYFFQQQLEEALAHYKRSAEMAPNYSQVYNLMGYCLRQKGDYSGAEQAFKKYIELIPNDPNPYDSYAELLLKMGRYEDSIAQYRKALSIDPKFNPSYFGLAADYMYSGQSKEAAAELQRMADAARNDGELRTAYFGMAVLASDSGKFDEALAAMDKEFAVAEKKQDAANMAADLQAKANILMQMKKYDAAAKEFDRALQIVQDSNLAQEIKNNATQVHHFNAAGVAIAKGDLSAARNHAEEFCKAAEESKNTAQLFQVHELAGRIALGEKKYDKAVEELQQANQQNAMNLFRLSEAYRGQGDAAKAGEYAKKAAEFNSLPALPYAFVRTKAKKAAGEG